MVNLKLSSFFFPSSGLLGLKSLGKNRKVKKGKQKMTQSLPLPLNPLHGFCSILFYKYMVYTYNAGMYVCSVIYK